MTLRPQPKIVISRCLGFDTCRWDGTVIPCKFVEKLKGHVEFITACPEADIGLGVPRQPVLLVKKSDKLHLIQSETGLDLTGKMEKVCRQFLDSLEGISAFIFKARSPSCGLGDVKVHSAEGKIISVTGTGFLARLARVKFPQLPIRDELWLLRQKNRESLLRYLFAATRPSGC